MQRGDLLLRAREQRDAGDLTAAEASCREALDLEVDVSEAHRILATVLHAAGRYDEALDEFDEAVRVDPLSPRAHRQRGEALAQRGRLAEAELSARTALELQPSYVGAAALLTAVKRFTAADDADLRTMEAMFGEEKLDDENRITLAFALAKAFEDAQDYERAFAYLEIGNGLRRRSMDYDVDRDLRFLERIASVFDRPLLERFGGLGSESRLPILIVGMPRSGTTLVEQILASHPEVHGAGELWDLHHIAAGVALLSGGNGGYPEGVPHLRRADFARLGDGYAHKLHTLGGSAPHVTDKAPMNFCHLGFLRLIAPGARVIHCIRDPVDTCLSCFSLDFGFTSVPCSYDLTELGRYYSGYRALMGHWRDTLPADWVLDVRYENVVADLETQARRLIAHCGLPWNDACLQFHQTNRVVHTSSFAQVRRPVYSSSIERWRRYESHLGPLLAALDR